MYNEAEEEQEQVRREEYTWIYNLTFMTINQTKPNQPTQPTIHTFKYKQTEQNKKQNKKKNNI